MKNIVVLVSGGGTNLQALINAQKRGEINGGMIKCVISSKADAYALVRAAENGIRTRVLPRKDYADAAAYSAAMRGALIEEQADLVVYAGFMTILDEQVCSAFPNRMINVHPALIPSFCGKGFYGLHVHEAALAKGVKVSGATVHFVTAECDAGPIILQKAVAVEQGDTPETLQRRIMEQAEWKILPQAVSLFCEDRIAVENGVTVIKSRVEITESGYYGALGGTLYSERYGCGVELLGKKTGEELLRRCAESFERLPDELLRGLYAASAEYLRDVIAENANTFDIECEITPENVREHLQPAALTAYAHDLLPDEEAPAAYSVRLTFTDVPDLSVEWAVRDNEAVYVGEYLDVSPWNDRLRKKSGNYAGA